MRGALICRLKCSSCGRLHRELPDCLVPYKHYASEVISSVLDGMVTPEDDDSADYPYIKEFQGEHYKENPFYLGVLNDQPMYEILTEPSMLKLLKNLEQKVMDAAYVHMSMKDLKSVML